MANLRRLPLSAFDPRLREVILRGCKEVVEIPCDNPQKAQNFRNTLTSYRARVKLEHKDKPDVWEPLYGTIISTKPGRASTVQLRPRLHEFDHLLDRLEISPEVGSELPSDPLAEFISEPKKDEPDAER